jgi:hypothetical protein
VGNAVTFVAVGEAVVVDASLEAPDLKAVGETEAVSTALDDAARIAYCPLQGEIALRLGERMANDGNALRDVLHHGAGLPNRWDLFERLLLSLYRD